MTNEEFTQQIENREKEIILEKFKKNNLNFVNNPEAVLNTFAKILKEQRRVVASKYFELSSKPIFLRTIDMFDLLCDCSFSYIEHQNREKEEKTQREKEQKLIQYHKMLNDNSIPVTFNGELSSLSKKNGWTNEKYQDFCDLRKELKINNTI